MRRPILALTFLLVLLALVVGLHFYLARRLVLDTGLEGLARGATLALIALLGASLVAAPVAERRLRPEVARWIFWPAAVWMGFAFLLVTALGLSDLVLGLAGSVASAAVAADAGRVGGSGPSRALAAVAVAGALGAVALRSGLRPPRLRRIEVSLRRWPKPLDGYRIVQLSDIHIGPILRRAFAEALVERVNALRPDLVAITGDLVDGRVERLAGEVAPFAELRAGHGVYFVTGNHDHYSGGHPWSALARELGMRVLRNERVTIGEGEASFELAGVEDRHAHLVTPGSREDLPAALAGRDPDRAVVLLAHDPSTFRQASRMGVDLQLSGHTHGGQIWPFGLVVRLFVPFVAGLYERNGCRLYVSRGTGSWGPPMRLWAPAEITEIVVRAERC